MPGYTRCVQLEQKKKKKQNLFGMAQETLKRVNTNDHRLLATEQCKTR